MGRKIKPLAWCDGGITYKYEEVCCEEEILDKIGHAALHDDLPFLVSLTGSELILSATTLVNYPFYCNDIQGKLFLFLLYGYNTGKVVIKVFW